MIPVKDESTSPRQSTSGVMDSLQNACHMQELGYNIHETTSKPDIRITVMYNITYITKLHIMYVNLHIVGETNCSFTVMEFVFRTLLYRFSIHYKSCYV